jgi:hypothetical protein
MKAVSFLSMRHLDMRRTTLKLPTESTEPTQPTQPIRFVCPCLPLSLDADMEEFEVSHPKDRIGPCFMSEKDFDPKFLQLVECEALAAGLPPLVCLSGPTLQCSPIPSDDTRSCATTPARDKDERKCWQCGEPTHFGFSLCTDCHREEGRKRLQRTAPRVQLAPPAKSHSCFNCRSGLSISPFVVCDECVQKCLQSQ